MKPGANRTKRVIVVLLAIILPAAAAVGATLLSINVFEWYGWSMFLAVPFAQGFATSLLLRVAGPHSCGNCLVVASIGMVAYAFGLLIIGVEGLLCIFMAAPIEFPALLLGAGLGYWLVHKRAERSIIAPLILVFVAVPALMAIEKATASEAPVFEVSTFLDIDAPPEVVWQNAISMDNLPPPDDWVLRTGLACPIRSHVEGTGVGATRRCMLTTGPLEERIEVWEEPRKFGWTTVSNPPPLKEMNPFRETNPPHLDGYFESLYGEFEFIPLEWGRTRLVRRTSYRHNMYPAAYWRLWCDFGVERTHTYVMRNVKRLSENAAIKASD